MFYSSLKTFFYLKIFISFFCIFFFSNISFNKILIDVFDNSNNISSVFFYISDITFSSQTKGYLNDLIKERLKEKNIQRGTYLSTYNSMLYNNLNIIKNIVFNTVFNETGDYVEPLINLFVQQNNNKIIEISYKKKEPIIIKKIVIKSSRFSEKNLKSILSFSEESLFNKIFFTKSYVFYNDLDIMKCAEDDLKNYLNKNGFLKPVIKVNLENCSLKNYKIVNINIEEGFQYIIKDVKMLFLESNFINNDNKIIRYHDILHKYLTTGTVYANWKKEKTAKHLRLLYKTYGYYDMEVFFDDSLLLNNCVVNNEDCLLVGVSITIKIRLGSQFFVNKIIFSGNEKTQDVVLRSCVCQEEQSILNYAKLLLSKNTILGNKYAANVSIILLKKYYNFKNYVDIILKIKEIERYSAVTRFSFTSDKTSINITTYFLFANFFGMGFHIYSVLNLQDYYNQIILDYSNPLFFSILTKKKSDMGLNIYSDISFLRSYLKSFLSKIESLHYASTAVYNEKSFFFTFFEERKKIDLCLTKLFSKYQVIKFGIGYSLSELFTYFPQIPEHFNNYFLTFGKKNFDLSFIVASLYNSLNDVIFPTKGFKHTFMLEFSFLTTLKNNIFKIEYIFYKFFSLTKNYTCSITGIFNYSDTFSIFPKKKLFFPFFRNYNSNNLLLTYGIDFCSYGPSFYNKSCKTNIYIGGNIFFYLKFTFFYNFKSYNILNNIKPGIFFDMGQFFNTMDYFVLKKNNYFPKITYGIVFKFKNPFIGGTTELTFLNILNKGINDKAKSFSINAGITYF